MAFCSNCGTQLSDGTKFCPKCGNPTVNTQGNSSSSKFDVSTPKNTIIRNDNSEKSLSTWEKIALGVAGIVAFTGICGGFADGMWIAALVSLCALGAVCAVFMGAIEKKYAWTTAIASLLIVLVSIGASAPDENEKASSQAQTEQQQESQTDRQAREKKEQAEKEAREKQEKVERVAKMAYQKGYDTRKATWGQSIVSETAARLEYAIRYGREPEDEGQSERWNVFVENYQKGFSDAAHDIMKKMDEEDF